MQLQHQVPDKVPEGSGADTSWGSGGFQRVPVKIPAEALEGSVRFRSVPVQIPCEVLEGSGGDMIVFS